MFKFSPVLAIRNTFEPLNSIESPELEKKEKEKKDFTFGPNI